MNLDILPHEYYTLPEIALKLKISRAMAFLLPSKGLPYVKIGRCKRVKGKDLIDWLNQNKYYN
jgi:hypothetical protein